MVGLTFLSSLGSGESRRFAEVPLGGQPAGQQSGEGRREPGSACWVVSASRNLPAQAAIGMSSWFPPTSSPQSPSTTPLRTHSYQSPAHQSRGT